MQRNFLQTTLCKYVVFLRDIDAYSVISMLRDIYSDAYSITSLSLQYCDQEPENFVHFAANLGKRRKDYRKTSISRTTFSGKKCLSGTSFHAI
jgi:hypothetical protein